jgi:predicted secreted acid phosphatase
MLRGMLKRLSLALVLVGLWSAALAAPPSREPANLDLLKDEIRRYVDSGKYLEDIAAVAAEAKTWVETRAAKRTPGERLTIVFDLDETLLSNWSHILSLGLGYQVPAWDAWVAEGKAPALEPVREVYRTARRLNIDVIFLTGRRDRDRPGTEKNLKAIGCADYAALICKPDASKEKSGPFKTATRAKLEAEGRVIIANLGDQQSDLEGGHAEKTFKLPNPFYLAL